MADAHHLAGLAGRRFLLLVLLAGLALPPLACKKRERAAGDRTASATLQKNIPPAPPPAVAGTSGPTRQAKEPSGKEVSRKETRFKENGDGTVTDLQLGLMWVKDPESVAQLAGEHDWDGGDRLCGSLRYAGHDDWRLPTLVELKALVDSARRPAIAPPFMAAATGYWTSTSTTPGTTSYVDFASGKDFSWGDFNEIRVRPVRRAPASAHGPGEPAAPGPYLPDANIRGALRALFPGSDWAEDCKVDGRKELCLRPVKRKGLVGCVPWSGVRHLRHWEGLAVLGFELYLSRATSPVLVLDPRAPPEAASKAVDVILCDTKDGKIIASFTPFPIEDSSWFCRGDLCSVPGIIEIRAEGTADGCGYYRVAFSRGPSRFLRFFSVCANEEVKAQGGAYEHGDLAGETGCVHQVEYELELEHEGPVTLKRKTSCDRRKECVDLGRCRPGTVVVMRDGKPVAEDQKKARERAPAR